MVTTLGERDDSTTNGSTAAVARNPEAKKTADQSVRPRTPPVSLSRTEPMCSSTPGSIVVAAVVMSGESAFPHPCLTRAQGRNEPQDPWNEGSRYPGGVMRSHPS